MESRYMHNDKFLKLNIVLVKASEMAVSITNFVIEDLQIY